MNNSELEKAYDEYEKLLDEKNYLEQDLADLGEKKGNAPKEEFDKVKEKLNAIYDKIEKVGEKIAELSKDNDESNERDADSKDSVEDRDENINNKISSNLIVEFEEREKEIYEGTFILDGLRMSEEEQKQKIIDMMKKDGVEVKNPDNLIISYEGADDDYGISETQTTRFVVKEKKVVPVQYRVSKEEIYRGTYILDGPRISEKQQRERIYNMMREAGVQVDDKDSLDIRYEGANDNDGISETQTSEVVVYRVSKEEVAELTNNLESEDKNRLGRDDEISFESESLDAKNSNEIQKDENMKSEEKEVLTSIVYELEDGYKDIYEGTLALDGLRMSEKEQKQKIIDMMKKDGVEVKNPDNLIIGYEGADDDYGISETQTTKFVVREKTKYKVPYKVTEEEIYRGTYILDGPRISEEEQKKRIYNMMREAGIQVGDKDSLDIRYEGASDDEGISETQTSEVVVYRVSKEKVESTELSKEEVIDEKEEDLSTDLKSELSEIKELKEQLKSIGSDVEREELISKISEKLSNLEKKVDTVEDDFSKELLEIEKNIKDAEKVLKEDLEKYEQSYEKLKSIITEYNKKKEEADILTDEELDKLNDEYNAAKMVENDNAKQIKSEIDIFKKNLSSLKRKRTAIKKDIMNANALGLSVNEYKEITSTLAKRKILDEVLSRKGLTDIINTPAKERTKEQKATLKQAKTDVLNEIAEFERNSTSKVSPLDAIVALYNIDSKVIEAEKPRNVKVKKDELMVINDNSKKLPARINNPVANNVLNNDTPLRAPEDMVIVNEIKQNENNSEKPIYEGVLANDPIRRSNAEIKQAILNEMIANGVDVDSIDDFDLEIEPVEDNNGISDSLYNNYKVYRKDREKSSDDGRQLPAEVDNSKQLPSVVDDSKQLPAEIDNSKQLPSVVDEKNIAEDEDLAFEEGKGLTEKYRIYVDSENNSICYVPIPTIERFGIASHGRNIKVDGITCNRISLDAARYIIENANNNYSPYEVEIRSIPSIKEFNENDVNERIDILTDENTGNKYARKYVFTRFNLDRDDSTLQRVDGAAWYRISDDDEAFIRGNAINDYSPYVVEDMSRELKPIIPEPVQPTTAPVYNSDNVKERIDILTDKNTGHKYARKYAFTRFNLDRDDSTLQRVDGSVWYRINDEDEAFIRGNANNDYSPYVVRDVRRELKPTIPDSVQQTTPPTTAVPTTGINITTPPTTAAPTTGINITTPPTTAAPTTIPKPEPEPVPKADDHAKPHVEEIINKLMTDLDVQAKDAKRYTASNIKVASKFKNELRSGNYLYNIVHVVPATFKSGISLFSKLAGKLMTSKRAKDSMHELEKRVNNLTEEELEVLFEEYRGSQLKTDMNVQINPLILPKLKEYGMKKVQAYNVTLTNCYASLFNDLGTINSIDEQLSGNIDDALRSQLEVQRKDIYAKASNEIRTIIDTRNKANNLLSGGIHGLEEDFKAVATKLSYAGMRFAKVGKFDNELQKKLAHEGKGLNTALYEKNDEDVVKHFVGLETLYHENTDIRGSVFGTRSEGAKYYSPLAAEFDYRDDPFIRDLFTTVSLTTATISAVNAFRVHQIEQQRIIDGKNQEINNANSVNDGRMDYVHQTANDITGKRQTFSEGMKAQAQQDSANIANAQERASLDSTNWGFGSQYRATDDAHHAFFNQNYDNVTSQINDITSRYGQGNITEAQALQELAQVANSSQSTLSQVASDCLNVLRPYAASHPQFDLHAVEESFNYMVANPDAIVNMNNAAIDVTNLAEGLKGLSAEHVSALSSLPSDMLTTFMAAASSAALAYNVSKSMDANKRKGRYGNQVTDMMNDYLNGSEEAEDVSENTRRR